VEQIIKRFKDLQIKLISLKIMLRAITSNTLLYSIVTFFLLHTTFFTLEHIHYKYCVPSGFSGYFKSIFSSNSPPCVTIRYISTGISTSIISLISLAGPIITSAIMVGNHTTDNQKKTTT